MKNVKLLLLFVLLTLLQGCDSTSMVKEAERSGFKAGVRDGRLQGSRESLQNVYKNEFEKHKNQTLDELYTTGGYGYHSIFLTIVLVCTILIGMILQHYIVGLLRKKGTITDIDDLLGENSLTSKLSEKLTQINSNDQE